MVRPVRCGMSNEIQTRYNVEVRRELVHIREYISLNINDAARLAASKIPPRTINRKPSRNAGDSTRSKTMVASREDGIVDLHSSEAATMAV